ALNYQLKHLMSLREFVLKQVNLSKQRLSTAFGYPKFVKSRNITFKWQYCNGLRQIRLDGRINGRNIVSGLTFVRIRSGLNGILKDCFIQRHQLKIDIISKEFGFSNHSLFVGYVTNIIYQSIGSIHNAIKCMPNILDSRIIHLMNQTPNSL